MCRPNASGGRRCPSHADPVKVANRNARRRAEYAKEKHVNEFAAHAEMMKHPLFSVDFRGVTKNELYTEGGTKSYESLGVTVRKHYGRLVGMNYLSGTEISGVINHVNLDPGSYEQFGFSDPHRPQPDFSTDVASHLSWSELDGYSDKERGALRFFCSDEYEWMNKALYKQEPVLRNEGKENGSYFGNLRDEKGEFTYYYYNTDSQERTDALLKETSGLLDSGLKKTAGATRIVYRGMKNRSSVLGELTGAQWAKQNLRLGQEMVFDGYQSATVKKHVATTYTHDDGVMFEIMTPEGAGANSVSEYENEAEVVLPRKSRYMVVGVHEKVSQGLPEDWKVTVVQVVAISEDGAALNSGNRHKITELKDSDYSVTSD